MWTPKEFVSRAGRKLAHALDAFEFDVTGMVCADFGCNVGGFTDCLLQRGAKHVYAIDTGYGVLAWKLRNDERVTVMERTNALHAEPPPHESIARDVRDVGAHGDSKSPHPGPLPGGEGGEVGFTKAGSLGGVDLVVIDLAWTPQRHAIPAALRWVKPDGSIIALVKPHYETTEAEKRELLKDGALEPGDAVRVLQRVLEAMPGLGVEVIRHCRSPVVGGKSKGNVEFLVWCRPA